MRAQRHPLRLPVLICGALALCLGLACDEKLSEPNVDLIVPDSLRATIGDTLEFLGVFTGPAGDVARHSWDFNSDGIFDFVWENFGEEGDSVDVRHAYSRADDYIATLQVTTVQNRLYRATTPVTITDQLPVLTAVVPDSVACGESFTLIGRASDDAGRRAFWDIGGEGGSDYSADFSDSVTVSAELDFDEPGLYTVVFGATDNDGHVERLEFEIVVGSPPRWESGSPMSEARADHAAAAAGGRLFVFGGRHGRGVVGSTEIYDPDTDSWGFGAALPTPRWGAEAVALHGDIYVIGGITQADTVFPMVEIYHPGDDSWTTFDPGVAKHVMPQSKRGFAALQVGGTTACCDSIMLIGGMTAGAVNDTTLIYYTANDSFSVDLTPSHFPIFGRTWLEAVTAWETPAQLDGDIFAVGGSGDGATPSANMESYDPLSDFWRNEKTLMLPRIAPGVVYYEGLIYVFGGGSGSAGAVADAEVYSLARERWEALPPMLLPRSGAEAVAIGDRLYLAGGATEVSSPYVVQGSRELQILVPWRCGP